MYNNLNYSYNDEKSILHNINPLCKFIGLFIYILLCLLKYNNLLFIMTLCLVFIMILCSNVSILRYFKIVWNLKYLIIVMYFFMLHKNMAIQDINIIIFKIVFLVLYCFLILYTTTKEDIGRGLAKILNLFNLIGINLKKISSFITGRIFFILCYIEILNKVVVYGEYRGVDYSQSNILNKVKIIIMNLKRVYKESKSVMTQRKNDMKYKLYDGNIVSKYKYEKKLVMIDYLFIAINIILVIYYVLKVR